MIRFENVTKKYGRTLALDGVNLDLPTNRVVGVLGPNGSGKTTFLKLIQGYIHPTKGKVTVDGKKIGPETKNMVSYLPDRPFMPEDFTIKDAKKLYSEFFEDFREYKFDELMTLMDLKDDFKIKNLSKGMSEKFHLGLILARDAKVYIIDEPIAGVDLVARDMILNAIFSNIEEGKLMIITTHLINELESLFDDVIYLANGKVVLQGNAEDLRTEKGKSVSDLYREIFGLVEWREHE